jgi:hypothetical protein
MCQCLQEIAESARDSVPTLFRTVDASGMGKFCMSNSTLPFQLSFQEVLFVYVALVPLNDSDITALRDECTTTDVSDRRPDRPGAESARYQNGAERPRLEGEEDGCHPMVCLSQCIFYLPTIYSQGNKQ